MNILSFSRSFWETARACGGAKENILRDYDILTDRKKGLTLGQLAIKYSLSAKQIHVIINKYVT